MSEADKGQAAMKASNYPTAIKHYTAALETSQSPLWLIQRSIAYHRSGQHELALADADNAVLASIKRGKRDLIATSQFRRAVALHGLGRLGDARLCLFWCHKRNEKEPGLTLWMAKIKQDYEKAGGDEAECGKTTVKETPDLVEELSQPTRKKQAVEEKEKNGVEKVNKAPTAPAAQTVTPKEKVRTEWYQSTATITIEVFAKGIPKEKAEVKIAEGSLDISFPIGTTSSSYNYSLDPLFSKIDPSKSSFRITPHKIEIILHKSLSGLKWSALEGTEPVAPSAASTDEQPLSTAPDETSKPKAQAQQAPAYPTSSKNGPVNWDTITGDDGADEDADVDSFFKKLYQGADPDMKRAMQKSYVESNGTSLSTAWSEVKNKTFVPDPPEGMQANKW